MEAITQGFSPLSGDWVCLIWGAISCNRLKSIFSYQQSAGANNFGSKGAIFTADKLLLERSYLWPKISRRYMVKF